jgi:glutathione S-transferase
MIEIFWASGSPYAWRALLALEIKKTLYTSRLIDFSKGQNRTPGYLSLNPRGKVPTLKDGDYVLSESLAIMAYLDRKYPEPMLFGRGAEETGRIWKAISDSAYYLEPAYARMVPLIFFGDAAKSADGIRAGATEAHREFQAIDQALGEREWLASDSLSAADIAVYPIIEVMLRAAGKEAAKSLGLGFLPVERHYPAIAAWRERTRAVPGYERTYPPHWRQ